MAALWPPRCFAAWRVEAFFFSLRHGPCYLWFICADVFPNMTKCIIIGKIAQTQCSRPYDTLTCYFRTAIWIGKCQSTLTQTQHCGTCSTRRTPSSWSCTVARRCKLGSPWKRSSRSSNCVGDGMLFNHQACCETMWLVIHVPIFRMEASDALLGIREGSSALLLPRNAPGNGNMLISHAWLETTTSFVFKDEILQAVQALVTQFRLFGTFTPNNVNAGGSAIFYS